MKFGDGEKLIITFEDDYEEPIATNKEMENTNDCDGNKEDEESRLEDFGISTLGRNCWTNNVCYAKEIKLGQKKKACRLDTGLGRRPTNPIGLVNGYLG